MPTVVPVRMHFNVMDLWFNPRQTGAQKGDHVVVTTERGTEFGLVTADAFEVPKDELKGDLKSVLRIATDEDVKRAEELAVRGDEAMPVFRQLVKESGLDMKPVGVEFLFGGEKAVFYFAAEDRVDFRDLVRDLASYFKQRVDMRQIGVRDEARLVGGYGPCGQELCCVRFGGEFEPVSIRMAKEQDLALNSSKISGVCGRLMCCLRYEFEAYRDFKQRAPKKNALIDTPLGKAKIVEYNTPRETLTLRLENGKSFVVALADMTCSEGCCKRAAEQHIPLRPDTVTREALEELGTPDIIMQLANLDRANGDGAGYVLDDSLLEVKRTPRRRNPGQAEEPAEKDAGREGGRKARGGKQQAAPGAGEAAPEGQQAPEQGRTPRRRSHGVQAAEEAPTQPVKRSRRGRPLPADGAAETQAQAAPKAAANPQEAGDEKNRRPRGGGMRPRRSKAGDGKQERTAQQAPERGAADKGVERSSGAAAPVPAQPQTRRTRRHHSAGAAGGNGAANAGNAGNIAGKPQGEQRAERMGGKQQASGEGGEKTRQQRSRRSHRAQDGGAQRAAGNEGGASKQQRAERGERAGGNGSQGGSQSSANTAGKPQGEQRAPRRRRPGDRGGQGSAGQGQA